ncbi:30S ribosomal protein S1 (plasmid) [Ureibacillus chungkukjangi]|uniref:RNA-binding protein n=1 Tax=Ureibacillus chungkukjangi TaxID=1202712 RepID=UPI000D3B951E|nr:RNA-binding protein [Ureibacillus chungkukjangi]
MTESITSKYVPSWTRGEQLNELTQIDRYDEMMTGIVRSIESEKRELQLNGEEVTLQGELLIVALPNGVTGYCAAKDFAIHEFKNTRKLVGRKAKFVIKEILLEQKMVILSGKEAQKRTIAEFWEKLIELDKAGQLKEHTFTGVVSGTSQDRRGITHVRILGQDCHMPRTEWSWNSRDIVDVSEGEEIEVKVTRFDLERKLVEVSRRLTLPDPFQLLEKLDVGDPIAGKVSRVDPLHGIFVQMESGLDVKASKVKSLESPIVGDMVTCRILQPIRREAGGRIKGRVVIVGYPAGKRKRKDLGSFLFE